MKLEELIEHLGRRFNGLATITTELYGGTAVLIITCSGISSYIALPERLTARLVEEYYGIWQLRRAFSGNFKTEINGEWV